MWIPEKVITYDYKSHGQWSDLSSVLLCLKIFRTISQWSFSHLLAYVARTVLSTCPNTPVRILGYLTTHYIIICSHAKHIFTFS